MRLKTKLVLAISAMTLALVSALSFIYVSQMVQQRVNAEYRAGEMAANEILPFAQDAFQIDLSSTRVDINDPGQVSDAIAESLQTDAGLNSLFEGLIGYSPTIANCAITGRNGVALLHSNPTEIGKVQEPQPDFDTLRHASFWNQLQVVYGPARTYEISRGLLRDGKPFGAIHVYIYTVFLKDELQKMLYPAVLLSVVAAILSLLLAGGLSHFALRPLTTISRQLDAMALGPPEAVAADQRPRDEVGVVTSKIDRLGREYRDVKEVFSALKENLDQIMTTLQDGLMLFTREERAVLVSASAETFLGRARGDVLGQRVDEIFSPRERLGQLVLEAFELRQPMLLEEVDHEDGRRIQVSLDFIEEHGEDIGALLTLRDAESVRRVENEIELSRRLAAIGQLTRGVAHEVKNPINAIVLHLEILRNKLEQTEPDTRRHMDVIGNEIQRLDRVVQMLVDFTRPVELRLADIDLRRLIDDVVLLASPDAEAHGVQLEKTLPATPLVLKIDADLVKQAVLNVVLNGVQAMPHGGTLTISTAQDGRGVALTIQDQGQGIPPDIREKIFDLYFTTKEKGSGIGLAMTFRVMQLHNGSVEFESALGEGTTFWLRFPREEATPRSLAEAAIAGEGDRT